MITESELKFTPGPSLYGLGQFATCAIKAGEEITYDYRTVVGKHNDWTMHCACGTEHCQGVIGSILSLPFDRLVYYKQLGALPDFILEELKNLMDD